MCDCLKKSYLSQATVFLLLMNLLAQIKVSSTDFAQDIATYLNRRPVSVNTGVEFLKNQATYLFFSC